MVGNLEFDGDVEVKKDNMHIASGRLVYKKPGACAALLAKK